MMEKASGLLISIGTIACFLACIGDFFVTFLLGSFYKDYHFIDQTQSFLGTSDSPVSLYMTIWSILLGILLIIYAFGLKQALPKKIKWSALVFWMLILYALGEGLGSGIFPYNHNGTELTLSGKLHSVFGGIGMISLMFLPLVVTRIYTKEAFPKLNIFSYVVFFIGLFFVILFMLSRAGYISYRGLWQRVFLLDYYIFLMCMAVLMRKFDSPFRRMASNHSNDQNEFNPKKN